MFGKVFFQLRLVFSTLDVIAEQVDKSDMEKERPNHLLPAEHGIVEEPKQRGDAGRGRPRHKNSHLEALTERPTLDSVAESWSKLVIRLCFVWLRSRSSAYAM